MKAPNIHRTVYNEECHIKPYINTRFDLKYKHLIVASGVLELLTTEIYFFVTGSILIHCNLDPLTKKHVDYGNESEIIPGCN